MFPESRGGFTFMRAPSSAPPWNAAGFNVPPQPAGGTVGFAFPITPLPQEQVIHTNVTCDCCGATRFWGIRYKCLTCPNYDLCERCEDSTYWRENAGHPKEHIFMKIRTPL